MQSALAAFSSLLFGRQPGSVLVFEFSCSFRFLFVTLQLFWLTVLGPIRRSIRRRRVRSHLTPGHHSCVEKCLNALSGAAILRGLLAIMRYPVFLSVLLLLGFALGGCDSKEQVDPPKAAVISPSKAAPIQTGDVQTDDSQTQLDQADSLAESGDIAQATAVLRQLLIVNPRDVEVLFRLANLSAAEGNRSEAIELLEAIPEDHPDAGLPALGQAADWCMEVERYGDAEQKYLRVLSLLPDEALPHRKLAYLLNRQGRRQEAAEHVRELCKLGDVRQDELHSLIMLNDAMYDDPELPPSDPSHPYWPIGASGKARRLYNQLQYDEALEELDREVTKGPVPPSVMALYGRVAIEAQNDERFFWWLSQIDSSVPRFSDYWAAVGTYLLAECRFEEAARALCEAIDRDPTDLISMGRLVQALLSLDQDDLAAQWWTRWTDIKQILLVNNRISESETANPDLIGELAERLDAADNKLESIMWRSIEASTRRMPISVQANLNVQRKSLLKSGKAFPGQARRLCGMDLERFPMPKVEGIKRLAREKPSERPGRTIKPVEARFVNIAGEIGLTHSFAVASEPQKSGFALQQFMGGAIAVLDFDLDGSPDLYFGQGGSDPPLFRGVVSNILYRNVDRQLVDVTKNSATSESRFSTGITAGDWNQDGFPDLVVSNLGGDVIFFNNGDGSFRNEPIIGESSSTRLPTSLAMADLTGDALPDLFQIAYVDDPDFSKRPKRNESGGVIAALNPSNYDPGADRLVGNDGFGGQVMLPWDVAGLHASTSLGVVVADFDGNAGNEIFIGNDLRANQFWKRDLATGQWSEVGTLVGCAYGYTGGATASMGIAAGDFDNSGTLDLHITNFQDDAASLYLSENGLYRDRHNEYQLNAASRAVLGFGTQAIDFDNDALLDLVVTNGHVEDIAGSKHLFEQAPQLFRNMNGRFELVDVSDASGYWSSRHLGRALATLDFNRDGRTDFAISHIEATSALLVNQTESGNHWLQLQLVGIESERDAIGASVKVKAGDQESTDWVMAGDGYFCNNESVLSIGLGDAARADEILIRWPSGKTQTVRDVLADRRLLIVEGQVEPFEL